MDQKYDFDQDRRRLMTRDVIAGAGAGVDDVCATALHVLDSIFKPPTDVF